MIIIDAGAPVEGESRLSVPVVTIAIPLRATALARNPTKPQKYDYSQ